MRFLADMGVDVRVVNWLRGRGHDEGLQRMPNGEIFNKAISENRMILTFDLDFGEIAALSRGEKISLEGRAPLKVPPVRRDLVSWTLIKS